jgi:hypothetical protein
MSVADDLEMLQAGASFGGPAALTAAPVEPEQESQHLRLRRCEVFTLQPPPGSRHGACLVPRQCHGQVRQRKRGTGVDRGQPYRVGPAELTAQP